jgi:hypothetical protein
MTELRVRARDLDRVARRTTRKPLACNIQPTEYDGQGVGNFMQSTGELRMDSAR